MSALPLILTLLLVPAQDQLDFKTIDALDEHLTSLDDNARSFREQWVVVQKGGTNHQVRVVRNIKEGEGSIHGFTGDRIVHAYVTKDASTQTVRTRGPFLTNGLVPPDVLVTFGYPFSGIHQHLNLMGLFLPATRGMYSTSSFGDIKLKRR